jgi:outer membrane immunogenic protein
MKKQFAAALGALILGIACGSARAADVDTPPAAYGWSGPYVGLQAGYGFGETEMFDSGSTTGDFDLDGVLLGATAGWNHQAGSFVFGLEGDISWSGVDGNLTSFQCSSGCNIDLNWLGTARLRAGFAIDNALIFATGGLAAGDVEIEVNDGYSAGTETLVGWTVGGGAELAVSEALSVKVEYLYVDLGDMETSSGGPPLTTDVGENHIIRAGVNWHF